VIASNLNDDYQGQGVFNDSEIHFTPTIKLDNGITYGARVEIEGFTASDQIDEHYVFIKGAFGDIRIGAEDAAHYNMHSQAPGGGWANYSDDTYLATYSNISTADYSSSDSNKIYYMSPSMNGLKIGVSYAPDTTTGGGMQGGGITKNAKTAGDYGSAYAVGAQYKGDLGGLGVSAMLGYQHLGLDSVATAGQEDREVIIGALSASMGGVKVGMSYKTDDKGNADIEQNVYAVGVSYTAGALTIGAGGGTSTTETSGVDSDSNNAAASLSYKIGPGVVVGGGIQYQDIDTQTDEALGVVMGVKLSF
jgi:outer membrane protein OmpU